MKLTQYTDFGLRALIALAVAPERLQTATSISEAYGISRNHLAKVAQRLQAEGYIETFRGRDGRCQSRLCRLRPCGGGNGRRPRDL